MDASQIVRTCRQVGMSNQATKSSVAVVKPVLLHTHTLGLSDPYCKFKLGSQKYKSKVIPKTLNPQWKDRFALRVYDGSTILHIEVWDRDFPQSDDFIGRSVTHTHTHTHTPAHTHTHTHPTHTHNQTHIHKHTHTHTHTAVLSTCPN